MKNGRNIKAINDSGVSTFEDTNSVMLIYTKKRMMSELTLSWYKNNQDIPDAIKYLLQDLRLQTNPAADHEMENNLSKRKRDDDETTEQITDEMSCFNGPEENSYLTSLFSKSLL